MVLNRIALLMLGLLLMGGAWAQPDSELRCDSYRYATRGSSELMLDLYRPAQPREDKACVVYAFGGGFYGGARDNKECKRVARMLTDRGFTVATIDYRLRLKMAEESNEPQPGMLNLFDEAIRFAAEDCCDALGYLCSRAEELGIDPKRIVLTGSSAGAITVLQTDYLRCNHDSLAHNLPADFRPAAVVAYSGAVFTRNGKIAYHYDTPAPTCFFHGTSDRIVSYKSKSLGKTHWMGAKGLDRVFDRNDYPHWTMRWDKLGHEVAIMLPKTLNEYLGFVDCALSGREPNYDTHCTDTKIQPSKFSKVSLAQFYKHSDKYLVEH